jgi:hypothetical protein
VPKRGILGLFALSDIDFSATSGRLAERIGAAAELEAIGL